MLVKAQGKTYRDRSASEQPDLLMKFSTRYGTSHKPTERVCLPKPNPFPCGRSEHWECASAQADVAARYVRRGNGHNPGLPVAQYPSLLVSDSRASPQDVGGSLHDIRDI